MRADPGSACCEVRKEEIDYAVAISADCAGCTETVQKVGSCLGDLSGRPRIPTVAGHGDHHRLRARVPSRTAADGRVADVHIAKKRARRGIVRPDLLFVREETRVLLGNQDWLHPGVLVPCCCCRYVIGARDVSRSNASERLAEVKRYVGIVEPRTVRP